MLFWIYLLLVLIIMILLLVELFSEKDWKKQLGLSLLLIPFILRMFLIK